MRKIMLLLLFLVGTTMVYSFKQKEVKVNLSGDSAFVKGKITTNNNHIAGFWLEGSNGNYSLILYSDSIKSKSMEFISNTLINFLKKKISEKLENYNIIYKQKNYIIIIYDNKKIRNNPDMKGFNLISFCLKETRKFHKETGYKITGYPVWENL